MSSRTKTTLGFLALAALMMLGSVSSLVRVTQLREHSTLGDVLFIPSAKALKRMSLGYNGLLADIYWTRAVQYFGSHHVAQAKEYDLLDPLLDITVSLDPKLGPAYKFGSIFLAQKPPQGAGRPDLALSWWNAASANSPTTGIFTSSSASSTTLSRPTTSRRRKRSSVALGCRARIPG